MSSKRKYSELDDSDDEEPTLGRQVLPVANLPEDFNGEPEDGMQYLFTVRRDARTLPRITRAVNPYEIKEEPQDLSYTEATLSAVPSALPSESWREVFSTRFKNFRKNCVQPTIHLEFPRHPSSNLVPEMKDRDGWWAFLQGRPESEWSRSKKPKKQKYGRYAEYGRGMRGFADDSESPRPESRAQTAEGTLRYASEEGEVEDVVAIDPAETLPTPSGSPAPSEKTSQVSQDNAASTSARVLENVPPEPTPMLLRNLDHRFSLHLLMYFSYWIGLYLDEPAPRVCRITETHARWMFALLSRVDEYLSADETSTLRSLARACMGLLKERVIRRASEEADVEAEERPTIAEASCWVIVAAVGGSWGQRDLWQDAQDTLTSVP